MGFLLGIYFILFYFVGDADIVVCMSGLGLNMMGWVFQCVGEDER